MFILHGPWMVTLVLPYFYLREIKNCQLAAI